jgi:hypothetical protein
MTTDDPVGRALSALKDADRARHAPSEIDRFVLEAFDGAVRERHTARHPTAAWTTRLIGLAAALTVIISSLAYVLERHRQAPSEPAHQAAVATAPDLRAPHDEILPSTAPPPPPVNAGADQGRRPVSRARTMVPRRLVTREPDVTQYMKGEFDDLVRVVRVRVPRATLASLGIAVIDPGAAGTVDLEVSVGVDGLARTIRLLR